MTIGEALKSLRLENGLTQKEMTGGLVSESFYSKVENGIHKIDADLLIDILSLHNFDIVDFFAKLAHQKRESKPSFELLSRIIFAQNKKDIKELDRISEEIKNGGGKQPDYSTVKRKLEIAYAWVLHSNSRVSARLKRKVKTVLGKNRWNKVSYTYLSQVVVLLDIDSSYIFFKKAFQSFKNHPSNDTFTLQALGYLGVNFLMCCYYYNAPKEYYQTAIEAVHSLPIEPAIGIEKLLTNYFEALVNHDKTRKARIVQDLKETGYYSIIRDIDNQEKGC